MEPGDETDPIARGLGDSALLVLGSALAAVFGFITLRLLVTGLSEAEYGCYGLLQQPVGLLTLLVAWAVPAVLRSGADEVEARRSTGGTLGTTLGTVGALTLGAAAAVVLLLGGPLALYIRRSLEAADGAPRILVAHAGGLAGWVVAAAVIAGASHLSASLLAPLGLIRWRTLVPALTRGLFAALVLLAHLRGALDLEAALALGAAATVPAVVVPLIAARGRVGRLAVDGPTAQRAATFAAPLVLRALAITGLVAVDPFVLRWWWPETWPVAVARYELAYRLAEQVVVFGFVLEFVGGPLLATAAARGDAGSAGEYLRRVVPPLALLWALGAALALALGEALLGLVGAPRAAESARLLELLLLGVSIRGVTTLENPLFDAHLVSFWPTVFVAVAFALNLVLDVILLAAGLGVAAPALATLIAFAAHAAMRSVYAGHLFGQTTWRAHVALVAPLLVLAVGRVADLAAAGLTLPTGATSLLAAWLAPAEGAGGWGVVARLVAFAAVAPATVLLYRRAGLLDPRLVRDIERIRMPAGLRRGLVFLLRDAATGEAPATRDPGPPGPGDERRRLLLLITELHPAGAERVVFDLATRIDRTSWRVVVASLTSPGGDDGAVHRALVAAGVEVVALRARGKLDLGVAWRLASLLRALRPHVLHAHLTHANLAARLVGRLIGGAAIVSTHHVVERRALPARLALERLTARLDDRTVAVSSAVAVFARRRLGAPRSRLRVVPNGVDLARVTAGLVDRRAAREALGLPVEAELVGAVGRLSAQKGVDLLLRAFAPVAASRPGAHLALAGAGEEGPALLALAASLGLAGRVTFLGFQDDVPRVLSALDVFAMPSRWEGFGLALVEALAAGKAAVVTAVDSLPELLGDAGRVVPAGDVAALATAIEDLLGDPIERARLGALARVRAARFDVQGMVAGHLVVYEELAPDRR